MVFKFSGQKKEEKEIPRFHISLDWQTGQMEVGNSSCGGLESGLPKYFCLRDDTLFLKCCQFSFGLVMILKEGHIDCYFIFK